MNKDLEHLKILSICYYVSAGLTALFSCIPFIHLFLGVMFVSGAFPDDKHGNPPPPFIGWLFIGGASVVILCGWALAVASFLAGKYIKQQRNYIFCLIIAGITAAFFPTGTILGVFTFIVLFRDSVKALFKGEMPVGSFGNNPPNWR